MTDINKTAMRAEISGETTRALFDAAYYPTHRVGYDLQRGGFTNFYNAENAHSNERGFYNTPPAAMSMALMIGPQLLESSDEQIAAIYEKACHTPIHEKDLNGLSKMRDEVNGAYAAADNGVPRLRNDYSDEVLTVGQYFLLAKLEVGNSIQRLHHASGRKRGTGKDAAAVEKFQRFSAACGNVYGYAGSNKLFRQTSRHISHVQTKPWYKKRSAEARALKAKIA